MSGSDKYKGRWHRCIVLPIILAWYFAWQEVTLMKGILTFMIIGSGLQITRIGYGIPDIDEGGQPIPESEKKGSILGRLCGIPEVTRGIAGILYSLSFWKQPLFGIYIYLNFWIGWVGSHFGIKAEIYERVIGAGVASVVLLKELSQWLWISRN